MKRASILSELKTQRPYLLREYGKADGSLVSCKKSSISVLIMTDTDGGIRFGRAVKSLLRRKSAGRLI